MTKLRYIRILVSATFFIAAILFLVVDDIEVHLCSYAEKIQISPSLLPTSLGVIIFWILITIIFGRIYCSSVCSIGTLSDIFIRFRKFIPQLNNHFSFKTSKKHKYNILLIYIISLIIGFSFVLGIIEPWSMFTNIISTFDFSPREEHMILISSNIILGFIIGFVSFVVIVVCAVFRGRYYCNEICPIGIFLSLIDTKSFLHIEIDPDKCIGCMECENECKASCIKVVSRYVDNSRCVRCFNCVSKCPNGAIRYQQNRNRVSTPMMQRVNNSITKIKNKIIKA